MKLELVFSVLSFVTLVGANAEAAGPRVVPHCKCNLFTKRFNSHDLCDGRSGAHIYHCPTNGSFDYKCPRAPTTDNDGRPRCGNHDRDACYITTVCDGAPGTPGGSAKVFVETGDECGKRCLTIGICNSLRPGEECGPENAKRYKLCCPCTESPDPSPMPDTGPAADTLDLRDPPPVVPAFSLAGNQATVIVRPGDESIAKIRAGGGAPTNGGAGPLGAGAAIRPLRLFRLARIIEALDVPASGRQHQRNLESLQGYSVDSWNVVDGWADSLELSAASTRSETAPGSAQILSGYLAAVSLDLFEVDGLDAAGGTHHSFMKCIHDKVKASAETPLDLNSVAAACGSQKGQPVLVAGAGYSLRSLGTTLGHFAWTAVDWRAVNNSSASFAITPTIGVTWGNAGTALPAATSGAGIVAGGKLSLAPSRYMAVEGEYLYGNRQVRSDGSTGLSHRAGGQLEFAVAERFMIGAGVSVHVTNQTDVTPTVSFGWAQPGMSSTADK